MSEPNSSSEQPRALPPGAWAWIAVVLLALLGVALLLWEFGVDAHNPSKPEAFALLASGGLAVWLIVRAGKMLDEERGEETRARKDQAALVQDIREADGVPELAELLKLSARQMSVYQDLSTNQARSSYRRSQFASMLGLALIVGAIGASFAGDDTTTKITSAGVAALGGALSAYISATYLRIYERALDQLNFYYRQPLINSYLLSAERIAKDMSGEQRDAAYNELLRQVLACAETSEPDVVGEIPSGPLSAGRRRRRPPVPR